MSTRARLILKNTVSGQIYNGSAAISVIMGKLLSDRFLKIKLPPNWNSLTKTKKLSILAPYLQANWKLTIIQEPKQTPKSKSLYWKEIENKAQGQVQPQGQAQREQIVWGRNGRMRRLAIAVEAQAYLPPDEEDHF